MAYDINTPQVPYTQERLPFYQVWIRAVTQPKPETFTDLANRPDATMGRALLWIFLVSMVTYLIVVLTNLLFSRIFPGDSLFSELNRYRTSSGSIFSNLLFVLLCGAPFTGVFAMIGALISAGLLQLVAKLLGGTGTYTKMLYVLACISIPVSLITGLLSFIPILGGCVGALIGIYALVLDIMAIKGVQGFGWGQAIATPLIIWIGVGLLVGCCVIAGAAFLAPVFQNIFQNIQDSIHLLTF